MKKINTYYTATSQIARKDKTKTLKIYKTLKEAIIDCKAQCFNVYTIHRVDEYTTLFGNFKRMRTVLTEA